MPKPKKVPAKKSRSPASMASKVKLADARALCARWMVSTRGANLKPPMPPEVADAYRLAGQWVAKTTDHETKSRGAIASHKAPSRMLRAVLGPPRGAAGKLASFDATTLPPEFKLRTFNYTNHHSGQSWATVELEERIPHPAGWIGVARYRVSRGRLQRRTLQPRTPWVNLTPDQAKTLANPVIEFLSHFAAIK